ncbi:hypothetical protein [Ignatzschineria cameli]|uniref:hypothetical protein n=1 Tax=Ignatzschineria cameli TaxID=2182793 RepID=UPI001300A021|nr:hypothetical protein [Ignatzschineria cameli]
MSRERREGKERGKKEGRKGKKGEEKGRRKRLSIFRSLLLKRRYCSLFFKNIF